MLSKLVNLFTSEPSSMVTPQGATSTADPNARHEGETYNNWGLRICATVSGSINTLIPCLHKIYNSLYQEQSRNQDLQEAQRNKIRTEIQQKQTQINVNNNNIELLESNIEHAKTQKEVNRNEKNELKHAEHQVNKEAKIKLWLGFIILIPLTIYLFIFYSSTFYSAFFKDFGDGDSVMNAMFDPNALQNAFQSSITELLFIIFAPVIFLGLGFALHFFTIQTKWTKYLKMASIICVTFVFDAILAYLIGKHLHELEIIYGTIPLGTPYGISEAVEDTNTWAVIFCGFIVYIIWGIVFDMTMSAYNQLDLNKIQLRAIDERITTLDEQIKGHRRQIHDLKTSNTNLEGEIHNLTSSLSQRVIIDRNDIKAEMVSFLTGWITQMNVLGMPNSEQQTAREEAMKTIDQLIQ